MTKIPPIKPPKKPKVVDFSAAKAAQTSRSFKGTPQDWARLYGQETELRLFDLNDLNTLRKSDTGPDSRHQVALFDVDELRGYYRKTDDWKSRMDYDGEPHDEVFRGWAERIDNGEVFEEMHRVPEFQARWNPETQDLDIFLSSFDEYPYEAIETAAALVHRRPVPTGRMPVALELEEPLSTWTKDRQLSGVVKLWADEDTMVGEFPLRRLKFPTMPDLPAFIDRDLERAWYANRLFSPRNFIEMTGKKNQPLSDIQGKEVVRSMYDPRGVTLAASQGDFQKMRGTVLYGAIEEFLRTNNISAKAYKDSYGDWKLGELEDLFNPSKGGKYSIEDLFETQEFQKAQATLTKRIETQKILDDKINYNWLPALREGDPQRYEALMNFTEGSAFTRGFVYGTGVDDADKPVYLFHNTRAFRWPEAGRQYLQEGRYGKEMGTHMGTAEQANAISGWSVLEVAPGDLRSPENLIGTNHVLHDKINRNLTAGRDGLKGYPGLADRVEQKLLEVVERKWVSNPPEGRGRAYSPGNPTDSDALLSEVSEVLRSQISDSTEYANIMNLYRFAFYDMTQVTDQIGSVMVTNATRPFRMWDHGTFKPDRTANAMLQSGLWNDDPDVIRSLNWIQGTGPDDFQQATAFLQKLLEEKGFDSIIYNNTHEGVHMPSVIVWDPKRIKPIHEATTFSRTNPARNMAVMPWWMGLIQGEEE